MTRFDIIQAYC